ncbi:LysE family translocator [Pseudogemmobacter sp. W21_MBD1_M6]|uniref:LysE family translocator n=1 Tax=Pseudogemmobacter sp. W21_MBD1_M6 TaxID=3240271 RepID=UPI003F996C39
MFTFNQIAALTAFAFVSSITPGPNNLMLMASGANFGLRRTLPHMMGVGLGFVLMIVLVGAGLMQVFDLYPVAHVILKTASVIYLVYLAYRIATAGPPRVKDAGAEGKPLSFLQAAAFQWVNPKAWTMALTAISVYTAAPHHLMDIVGVALIFGIVNLPSVGCWAYLGQQMSRFLTSPARLRAFNVTAAVLLVASLYPILFPQG